MPDTPDINSTPSSFSPDHLAHFLNDSVSQGEEEEEEEEEGVDNNGEEHGDASDEGEDVRKKDTGARQVTPSPLPPSPWELIFDLLFSIRCPLSTLRVQARNQITITMNSR